jgi:EAL domain-containing protein (putative c-di-GMP-specific phosphodiesterase class I)
MVRAIVGMARELGIEVIAPGVKTEAAAGVTGRGVSGAVAVR